MWQPRDPYCKNGPMRTHLKQQAQMDAAYHRMDDSAMHGNGMNSMQKPNMNARDMSHQMGGGMMGMGGGASADPDHWPDGGCADMEGMGGMAGMGGMPMAGHAMPMAGHAMMPQSMHANMAMPMFEETGEPVGRKGQLIRSRCNVRAMGKDMGGEHSHCSSSGKLITAGTVGNIVFIDVDGDAQIQLDASCDHEAVSHGLAEPCTVKKADLLRHFVAVRRVTGNMSQAPPMMSGMAPPSMGDMQREDSEMSFGRALGQVHDVPEEFECPITLQVMDDPVIASDGITYERKAIEDWFSTHDTSPANNKVLENKLLTTNYALKGIIGQWQQRSSEAKASMSSMNV